MTKPGDNYLDPSGRLKLFRSKCFLISPYSLLKPFIYVDISCSVMVIQFVYCLLHRYPLTYQILTPFCVVDFFRLKDLLLEVNRKKLPQLCVEVFAMLDRVYNRLHVGMNSVLTNHVTVDCCSLPS